ncbi:MAG: hypothetical protein KAR79_04415 [Simkaniaceae bacterium]|nr:hypothetical protein [Simkaniaceae bacterium]
MFVANALDTNILGTHPMDWIAPPSDETLLLRNFFQAKKNQPANAAQCLNAWTTHIMQAANGTDSKKAIFDSAVLKLNRSSDNNPNIKAAVESDARNSLAKAHAKNDNFQGTVDEKARQIATDTGIHLGIATQYVTTKRKERALFLLNSFEPNLQITKATIYDQSLKALFTDIANQSGLSLKDTYQCLLIEKNVWHFTFHHNQACQNLTGGNEDWFSYISNDDAPVIRAQFLESKIIELRDLSHAQNQAGRILKVQEKILAEQECNKVKIQDEIDALEAADPMNPDITRKKAELETLKQTLHNAAETIRNPEKVLLDIIANNERAAAVHIRDHQELVTFFNRPETAHPHKVDMEASQRIYAGAIDPTTLTSKSCRTEKQQLNALLCAINGKEGKVHGWLFQQILSNLSDKTKELLSYYTWEIDTNHDLNTDPQHGENILNNVVYGHADYDIDLDSANKVKNALEQMLGR